MKTFKKILPLFVAASALSLPSMVMAQTVVFNDTFGSSTLNGTSTPGGTPSASSTSYDVASSKTGACTISGTKGLLETISSATSAGYVELQALFTATPVQLVNVGDSINLTMTFTNTANLIGGSGSEIAVGLYNSGGYQPVPGALNAAGLNLTSTTYGTNYCQWWQGYVAQVTSNTVASTVYTRPQQVLNISNAVQDLIFSGVGTGLYKYPAGTQIGSSLTSTLSPLTAGGKYTMSFTITITGPGTTNVTIVNNLYSGSIATGTLISAQTNTTTGGIGGTTYTNYANLYDGLSIGVASKGPSLQPEMTISQITISTNYFYAPVIAGLTNQTIIAGNNLGLNPTVSANPAAVYQWQTNGVNVGGATSASLAVSGVQYVQNGWIYSLIASNSIGLVTNSMTLTVVVAPSIAGLNPQAAAVGDTVVISPTVGGEPVPTCQWAFSGTNLVDQTNQDGSIYVGSATSTLNITNVQVGEAGTYWLIVSNSVGVVSNSMLLSVGGNTPPLLTGPTNLTVIQGNNATFTAAFSGVPEPTLQWLDQTGTPIPGATSSSLTLNNVQYSQNGFVYSLVASNSVSSITNTATLTVIVPPAITTQPSSLIVTNTQSASFTVVATGVPSPTFQWYSNSVAVAGATSSTFTIASASPAAEGSTYYVYISNSAGSTNSTTNSLTVNSTMAVASVSPNNGATGICYDAPLYLTFNQTPTLRTAGKIRIYNVLNSATPVDTIDLSLCTTANSTYAANIQPYNIGGSVYTNFPVIIKGATAAIYPHHGILTSNQTYYVTLDDGTFADAAGAYFAGISATNVWSFATKAAGPVNPTNLVVAADGSGDFLTVQGAVDSVPLNNTNPTVINVRNGFYTESVDVLSKNNLDFRGQSRAGTFIGYPNNNWVNGNGAPWRSMFIVNGNNCSFENLTISNTTPAGGSQAEAMDIEGTFAVFCNMELDSYQDTFLVHSAGKMVYFQDSLIQGQTDFNWGYGSVYYTNCIINCLLSGGHVTQPRSGYTTNGFGFINCRITQGYSGAATFDLGRTISTPTSPSEVLYYNCLMADVITGYSSDAGTNMSDYNCSNLTATVYKTLANSTHLLPTDGDPYITNILSASTWLYGWQPQLAPNILTNPVSQTVNYGSNATFTVAASGVPNPTYQWQTNGVSITGATAATLNISGATTVGTNSCTVIVTTLAGSVTSSPVAFIVNPPPIVPPVFTAPPNGTNITINVGVSLAVSCTATDASLPPPTLAYSLLTGPSGAAVDSGSGNFTWRPTAATANSVNSVQVVVTDNGSPALYATNAFTVTVNPLSAPTTSSVNYSGGQFSVSINGQVGPDYELQGTTNLSGGMWTDIATTNSPATMPVILTDPNAGSEPATFYRIVTGPPLP